MQLLPHLGRVAREARLQAGLTYAHVAVHLERNGRTGAAESTLLRFEKGLAWPTNPDAMIGAYATATGKSPKRLWSKAIRAADD